MVRQGKWFESHPRQEDVLRLRAMKHAWAKKVTAWEIQYIFPQRTVFYAGEKVPQKVLKLVPKGLVQVLQIWGYTEEAKCPK